MIGQASSHSVTAAEGRFVLALAASVMVLVGSFGCSDAPKQPPPPQFSAEEVEATLIAAERYREGGELVKSHLILTELLEAIPDNVDGLALMAEVTVLQAGAAREELDFAAAESGFEEAHALYERIVELQPNHAGYRQSAADIALAAGEADVALEHYRKAAELEPEIPRHPLYESQILAQQENWPAALEAIERAIALDPHEAHALATRAAIRFEMDEYDSAFADIREARGLARTDDAVTFRVMEARLHRLDGRPERTLQLLMPLLREDRTREDVTTEASLALHATNQSGQAVLLWKERYDETEDWRAALGAAEAAVTARAFEAAAQWLAIARDAAPEHQAVAELERKLEAAMRASEER